MNDIKPMKTSVRWVVIVIAGIAASLPAIAQVEQPSSSPPPLDKKAQKACMAEVKKVCPIGFPPNKSAVRRCVAENEQRLSPQCRTLIQQRLSK